MKKNAVILLAVILIGATSHAQCPTLGQNATFTSADCLPGSNPCALCPGDQYTLTPTGTNLHAGDCINWYINDMPNFNPYNGEGTLLGCSMLSSPPPDPCNPNPILLGLFVNACGTEENNEFLGIWSGGGFNISDLMVSYNDPNNNGCGFQTPSGALQAAISTECPGAVFVGAGDDVPANVPLVIFASSDADFDYNFSGLCATNGTFYVTQSDCSQATEVFPNTGVGTVTTGVSIGCWSDNITYDLAQIANSNGAFVAEIPILGTFYGQAGCAWPSFPGLPGGSPVVNVAPLDVTIAADQCNAGPFYIVGIYDPLPAGCPQTFTNTLQYDVLCPSPVLGTTDLCSSVTNYNLVQLQDPTVPAGAWSGDGVTGSTFNATGLSGAIPLTFTPTSPCGTPATTVINVSAAASASFDPVPSVCSGGATTLTINFTGTPSWDFNLLANGTLLNSYTATSSPFDIVVNPTGNTNYSLQNLMDGAGCSGPNTSVIATVSNSAPNAVLSLVGNDTICAGSSTLISIDFSGGTPPYDFIYSLNGTPQTEVLNISQDPYVFPVTINNNSNLVLVSVKDDNGCTGTVSGSAFIRVLPAPTAALVSDTVTICTGATDTLVVNLAGKAPFMFVYRINGVNQPAITTSTSPYKIVVTPTVNPTVYTLFSVTDSICSGTVSGTYRINLIPTPTVQLSGSDTICAGQSATLTFDFAGPGPYTVDYTANTLAQPTIQTSNDPFTLVVSPTVNTTYALTSFSAGGCTGSISGSATIAVPPAPTAVISGGGQICQGGTGTTVTITSTGIAPFTFTYTANNINPVTVTTNLSSYTFNVNPGVGTGYRLVSMNDAICSGTFSGIAQVFVFVPASATLSGSAVFCDSANTTVMVDFNGSGPFTIEYTINNVLQPPVFTSDDPYFIPVSVNSTTTYVLTNVESPGCTGIPQGSATITVNYAPSYANLNLNCNAAAGTYTVSFDVLNGALPMTLLSGSGTFTGNQFTSNPIPQGSGYSFVFHDANDCGDITVSGPSTCNCTTAAGTMSLTQIDVCESQQATATYNGGFFDDGNDILMYILHTNAALPLGTILAWSATPTFGFQGTMTIGTTYYISAIAGNNNGSGQVDLNDPCMKVAQGTPVVFHAAPTADIGNLNVDMCLGDSLIINVNLTGTPNFSITPQFGAVQQTPVTGISGSTYGLVVHTTQNLTVTLANVSDQFCPAGNATGTVNINVVPPPDHGAETIVCDYVNLTYTVSFPVTGTPPFNINGLLATFNGTAFTSLPIPFGTPYLAYITDANNCGQDTISGLGVCSCLSDAGTVSTTLVNACANDTLTVPAAMNTVVDPGDLLMYVMHTNQMAPLGTILAWSTTPSFTFAPPMLPNVTYYVSAIVGNPNGMGQVDLNDPCLSIASSTPVLWYAIPTATLTNGTFDICPGQSQALIVSMTGTAPYILTYTSNGNPFTVFPSQNLFSINAQLQQSANLLLTSITDAHGCMGTVTGDANVRVHPTPVVINITPVCDFAAQTYVLEFDVTKADTANVTVSNIAGTYDPVTGHFVSDPIPVSQPYNFTVTDIWGCGSYMATNMVDCSCDTDAGSLASGTLILCPGQNASVLPATGTMLEPGDTLVYLLVSTPSPTTWTILATSATPDFAFNPATMVYETTYYIVAAAGNIVGGTIDLMDPCFASAPGASVVWRTPVTATLSGADTICIGSSAMLQVNFTGSGPYFFTYTDGGVNQVASNIAQNPYTLMVSPTVSSTYSLVGVSGAGTCLGTVTGTADVQVNQLPQAVNVVETCDFTTETVIVTFDISNGPASNSTYSISGIAGTLTDTSFTSLPNPGGTPYQITITDDIGCSSTLNGQPACLCTSSAGTLSNVQDACLPNGQVSAQSDGNSNLDPDDVLHYILCTDPALLPAGILAESTTPQFSFQPGMNAETTYFIVIGVGNVTGGNLDFTHPCRSLSAGYPVVFHNMPTATITGSANVCPGGTATFTVAFTGEAPYKFTYAINGQQVSQLTSPINTFSLITSNVQHDQVFTLLSLEDVNCTGSVTGQATVTLIDLPTVSLAGGGPICLGDTIALSLELTGGTSYNVSISGGATPIILNGVTKDTLLNVFPSSSTTYTISALTATGNICPAVLGSNVTVTTDQVTATSTLSNYNGFNVSCPNGTDGSIALVAQTSHKPITATWSDGSATDLTRNNLAAGSYTVTLTNQIGCTWTQSFDIQAPPELGITFDAVSPVCFGDETGSISLNSISGGAGPYNLLLNNVAYGPIDTLPRTITDLGSGDYTIGIEDANGCISDVMAVVQAPLELMVNLGPDTLISFGDSLLISAIHNSPQVDTFIWSPLDYLSTPDQLQTWARPLSSLRYSLYLRDELGCEASDEILIQVQKDRRVYIPNVINPESSTFNDVITVWGGAEVAKVRYMRIFDRWGELLFENKNFLPSDPQFGWNGRYKGEFVDPAVFVYVIEVEYIDGETQVFKGDVTVVR